MRQTTGLIVLQGGGDDVDENYVRMGARAGGGDFVVLRASGEDDYNDYIYKLCQCDSVETIVFHGREAASDPYVIRTIRNAEALFIAGGDQSRYVRFWQGTPVEDAINFVAAKPAPVGGTSAGMAILGEFSYSAMGEESLTSRAALADPFAPDLTFARDFLEMPGLHGVLTDQHLWERDRIGRTVTLLARLLHDGWIPEARGSPPTGRRPCTSIRATEASRCSPRRTIRRRTCTFSRRAAAGALRARSAAHHPRCRRLSSRTRRPLRSHRVERPRRDRIYPERRGRSPALVARRVVLIPLRHLANPDRLRYARSLLDDA